MKFAFKNLKSTLICFSSFPLIGCETNNGILNPKGIVAFIERQLLFDTTAIMLIVIIPVIIMSIAFTYHYREKNHQKKINSREVEYKPNWSHSHFYESLWWSIPFLIVFALAIMTWIYTHKLDPYRKLKYAGETVQVQVVSLPWKWLFIYPKYNIATVNHLVIPNERQIELFLTCDNVPMSSFMIPQLGSQIYTMAGMETKLHLIPTHTGELKGLNTQYNGEGFSEMHFRVDVKNADEFAQWVALVKNTKDNLNANRYSQVRQPQINAPLQYFSGVDENLFTAIVTSYHALDYPTELEDR